MKKPQWLVAVLLALALTPAGAMAQERGSVTGTVIDRVTQQPLSGVQVVVANTTLGTLTNQQGRFTIPNVPSGTHDVRASYVGYGVVSQTVTVGAGQQATANFSLNQTAIALDAVVVTGTAGRQEVRAQSAAVSKVNAAELTEKAPITTVTDLIQGRNPGVSVTQSSGTSGTAQRIRLRGQASYSLSSDPIVFIDGVRANTTSGMTSNIGGQVTSHLNDIRPEDIESIEIVKGPAAATLYGADASAGVIQIITKKGRAGGGFQQNLSLEYNSIDINGYTPEANYGVCTAALVANSAYPACYGKPAGTVISDRPSDRYPVFRTGEMRAINWSGTGGGENYGFRLSVGKDNEDGVFANNYYNRFSNALAFNFTPSEKVKFEAGWNMINTKTALPRNDNNIYGFLGGIMLGTPTTVGRAQDGWYAAYRQVNAIKAEEYEDNSLRMIPRVSVNYMPFSWFTNRLMVGADITRSETHDFYPKNDSSWYATVLNTGQMDYNARNRDDITAEYMGTITNDLTSNWSSTLSFGTQINARQSSLTYATGTGFITNANRSVNSAATRTGGQSYSESRQMGAFAQWQPVFKDRLYLQMAARLDRTSAFGTDAAWFLSPKVGASYVISEEPFFENTVPHWINLLRLRAAWGTTGKSPGSGALVTYSASPYAITSSNVQTGVIANNPGNSNLRPERGEEFEAGFDLGLFDQKVGLEVTFFDKVTKDLILTKPIAPSLGYSSNPLYNIGSLYNRGWEVAANANVFNTRNLGWDLRVGFNTLKNEVTDLGEIQPIGTYTRVLPGYQLNSVFDYLPRKYITDAAEAATKCKGAKECVIVSDTTEFLGHYMPGFEGNASTTISFLKHFQLNAMANWQTGFMIYNNTARFRDLSGVSSYRANHKDQLPAEERLKHFGPFITEDGRSIPATSVYIGNMEKGDYLRLREVSLTYSMPRSLARSFHANGASITLAGRNLGLWTKYSGADPEVLGDATETSRTDFLTMPQTRRWVARVNLNF
jgi:TonB-linked SusC/RagA family outer membrane protein